MADSLRCRAKSGTKGSGRAVLRASRLTTLGVTGFRCVSDFGYATAAHILRTGTMFEALPRAHDGGSASATLPTRPHREFETYRFTLRGRPTFGAAYMEATVPLRVLGRLPVHTALEAVAWYHPDRATRIFGDSGPQLIPSVSAWRPPYGPSRESAMALHVPQSIYTIVVLSRIDPHHRDWAMLP
jgi:hypothetical protein